MQVRILFLGGSYFQLPPLLYAREKGYYVIVFDYLSDNPGQKYADAYYPVSTTDVAGVLQLASKLNINGIVAYASDPAASTAAYVAQELNLPGNPFHAVQILSRKDLYRAFLRENHFHAPLAASFSELQEAEAYLKTALMPVMIKPVDASGSKGVSKIDSLDQVRGAFMKAVPFSRAKKVIIETYIKRKGFQIAGDGLVIDGKLVFTCLAQEHFENSQENFTPVGESFPLQLSRHLQDKIHHEIQRLLSLLNMRMGALNFDIILSEQEDVYLMEVGPRAGGNLISEVVKYSTGVNLVEYIVDGALGLPLKEISKTGKAICFSSYILHASKDGFFKGLEFHSTLTSNIFETHLFVKTGMPVKRFENSSGSIGCVILRFDSPDEMLEKMQTIGDRIQVRVE